MSLRRDWPEGEAAAREALYRGEIFLLGPSVATQELVAMALGELARELGPDPRRAQFDLSDEEFFARIGRLRRSLHEHAGLLGAARAVLFERGFDGAANALDPCRLRVIAHGGGGDPRARPIYAPHRDTWYSHPQCQLSWWVPLHDVSEEESFVFYPERFARAVPNDSEGFDYGRWTAKDPGLRLGWQDPEAGRREHYPAAIGYPDAGRPLRFSARAGELLVFAGAHYHRTLPHRAGRTRFSLDFRSAHLGDHAAGRGAPNVDNRSTGSALDGYLRALPVSRDILVG